MAEGRNVTGAESRNVSGTENWNRTGAEGRNGTEAQSRNGTGTENRYTAGSKDPMQTRLLPKNYRQIGEPGAKKIYIEDYVYTYLNRMAQPGNLYSRGAILFGKAYQTVSGSCLFISGAASCQSIEFDLAETVFSEEVWDEIYRVQETYFPDLSVCGWFLSRMGFSVELNDKIIRMHVDNFSGDNKVLYMIDVLENEDAFYQFENYSLKKQKGYYIYYETNHAMAEYIQAEGGGEDAREIGRNTAELVRDHSVMKNYKKAMQQKKAGQKNLGQKNTGQKKGPRWTPSAVAGAAVIVMALTYGAYSVHQFRQDESMKAVFGQQDMLSDNGVAEEDTGFREEDSTEQYQTGDNDGRASAEEKAGDAAESDGADTAEDEDAMQTASLSDADSDNSGGDAQNDRDDSGESGGNQDGSSDNSGSGYNSGGTGNEPESDANSENAGSGTETGTNKDGTGSNGETYAGKKAGSDNPEDADSDDTDVFTQEDPDELVESWSYLGGEYTVRQGDTLASISKKIYQSYDYIQKIADVNEIENIDRIYPGQVLKIPRIDD